MFRKVLTGGVLLGGAALAAMACGPLPGTSQCSVGRTDRTILCSDICEDARDARSETERQTIIECAKRDCGDDCK